MDDKKELCKYDGCDWKNKYHGAEQYYNLDDESCRKPFIAVPIITDNKCFGVIRVTASKDGKIFPNWAYKMFLSFAGVISKRIKIVTNLVEQQNSIENYIKLGTTKKEGMPVYRPIVQEARKLVDAFSCDLYLLDRYGVKVELRATTEPEMETRRRRGRCKKYERGTGLTGWIFKTGKPLIGDDPSLFQKRQYLSNQKLEKYSDSSEINKVDRWIKPLDEEFHFAADKYLSFLGVPLQSPGGKTHGVLLLFSRENSFTRSNLNDMQKFVKDIALFLAKIKWQELNNVLIRIGHEYGDDLFQYVVKKIPRMVMAHGCSIFMKNNDDLFELRYTSSPKLMIDKKSKKVRKVTYKPGVGKTGLVAETGRILIINHYGSGN
ncbi:MAG: GAF domain-containing protein, partial [Desulfobulbaceae bacterium]|nr:GAF domain-containing protein [Desulfobulbaceae bacterium]